MKRTQRGTPPLRVLRRVIRAAVRRTVAAMAKTSPGGRRITPDEWKEIGEAILEAALGAVEREVAKAAEARADG